MAFPSTPTNGQIAVVGGIAYQYATTPNSWSRILSSANVITANTITVGTLTANTLNVNSNISATGNVTGNYFFGNGSQLTGIDATSIQNGTSNVRVVSSGGNVSVGIGGTSNVAVFANTGEYVTGVISATGNVTGGNVLTAGLISATGTLSVTGATTLTTVSTGNISAGNIYSGGSITTGSLISAVGNINAASIIASGIVSANNNIIINSTGAEGGQLVMAWPGVSGLTGQANSTWNLDVDSSNNLRAFSVNANGTANVLLNLNSATRDTTLGGNLVPATSNTYSLGNSTNRWANLWLTGNTIYLGNAVITSGDSGDVIMDSTGSFAVPVGTTAERSAIIGAIRYNTTIGGFETFDGAGWNKLAYGTATDFPFGDYGSLTDIATTDAFGVSLVITFDCNDPGPLQLTNLGDGEAYVGA
jgi:hypothetical protein